MSKAITALAMITKPQATPGTVIRGFRTPDGRERLGVYSDPGGELMGIVSIIYDQSVRGVLDSPGFQSNLVSVFESRG